MSTIKIIEGTVLNMHGKKESNFIDVNFTSESRINKKEQPREESCRVTNIKEINMCMPGIK